MGQIPKTAFEDRGYLILPVKEKAPDWGLYLFAKETIMSHTKTVLVVLPTGNVIIKTDLVTNKRLTWEVNLNGLVPHRILHSPYDLSAYLCSMAIGATPKKTEELSILEVVAIYVWSKLPYALNQGVFTAFESFTLLDSCCPQPAALPLKSAISVHKENSISDSDD